MSEQLRDLVRSAPGKDCGGRVLWRGGFHPAWAPLKMGQVDPARLVLAHVNHQLRGEESERDEAAARQFAERFGLRFAVFREDVAALARREGLGLEECGRKVRYDFFQSPTSGENDRIPTGLTTPTITPKRCYTCAGGRLCRGCWGSLYRRGKILRPFLTVSRKEIEEYCREQGLSYVTDSTNLS